MTIHKISVLGSGTMGVDIAILFAQHGFAVTVWHRNCADTARQRVRDRLDLCVRKEVISTEASDALRCAIRVTDSERSAADADLAIESVVEDHAVKEEVLSRFDRLMPPDSLLVTNTSSLSVTRLGEPLSHKGTFAGYHFFNPATKMELVEIIAGTHTAEQTVVALRTLAEGIGKTAVLVTDTPGFIVNRLLMIQINSAIQLLSSHGAAASDIDQAMVLGLGHKRGPLALADMIGLDVVSSILTSLHQATGNEAYRPDPLLGEMLVRGHLGRKTSQGFHTYEK